ncbi:MAG: DUF4377 domain-containing protein [Ferruginibacter sp.]|nr:DUF4377 domain-containing protein [Cytophagales bacterium]
MGKHLLLSCLLAFTVACKQKAATTASPEITLRVNYYKTSCTGEGINECLLVQQDPLIGTDQWQYFYAPIEGFDYQPGFVYDLRVRTEQVENPPPDASSLRYILVKVVSKVKK